MRNREAEKRDTEQFRVSPSRYYKLHRYRIPRLVLCLISIDIIRQFQSKRRLEKFRGQVAFYNKSFDVVVMDNAMHFINVFACLFFVVKRYNVVFEYNAYTHIVIQMILYIDVMKCDGAQTYNNLKHVILANT